nr:MAG TPA: hypothetical protein [Caudoviricetes sp.]
MIDKGIVHGSESQAKPLIVGVDTVYVHTNIIKLETDVEGKKVDGLYQYNEVQYGKDEYIQLMSEKNTSLEDQMTQAQEAMCEIYEMMA